MSNKYTQQLDSLEAVGLSSLYPGKFRISVGMATCGLATGAGEVFNRLGEELKKTGFDAILSRTGCLGFCQMEPVVDLFIPDGPRLTFVEMTPEKATDFIKILTEGKIPTDSLLCVHQRETLLGDNFKEYGSVGADTVADVPLYTEVPFFAKQNKIALRNCGVIDPVSIEEYVARSGYRALLEVLSSRTNLELIDDIKTSGLRGRGGGGFPTGLKWEYTLKTEAD